MVKGESSWKTVLGFRSIVGEPQIGPGEYDGMVELEEVLKRVIIVFYSLCVGVYR